MLEQKIEALTRAVEALTQSITSGTLSAPQKTEVTDDAPAVALVDASQPADPAPAPVFDEQALKAATLAKSRAGHKSAIRAKLDDMGVKKLQDLAQDQAAEFYQWVVALGDN